jgi:hypothetical protein
MVANRLMCACHKLLAPPRLIRLPFSFRFAIWIKAQEGSYVIGGNGTIQRNTYFSRDETLQLASNSLLRLRACCSLHAFPRETRPGGYPP